MARQIEDEVKYYYDSHPTTAQADAEAKRSQMLVEKMRALGIDPNQLI